MTLRAVMPTRKTSSRRKTGPRPGVKNIYDEGYRADYADLVRKLAMLGLKENEMAEVMDVSFTTLRRWKESKPEFCRAMNEGKVIADANVADALFRTAIGYERDEEEIKVVNGVIERVPVKRYYPGVPTSMIFWLKNRQRVLWRDKVETGVTDKDGNDVPAMDPQEAARRIAFVLANGAAAMEADAPKPEVKH